MIKLIKNCVLNENHVAAEMLFPLRFVQNYLLYISPLLNLHRFELSRQNFCLENLSDIEVSL